MTLRPVAMTLSPTTMRLMATMTGARYLIVERNTGDVLSLNNYGMATRWSYTQKARAVHHAYLASKQIRPAILVDMKTGETFDVTK